MISQLLNLLNLHPIDADRIYGSLSGISQDQSAEIALREPVSENVNNHPRWYPFNGFRLVAKDNQCSA